MHWIPLLEGDFFQVFRYKYVLTKLNEHPSPIFSRTDCSDLFNTISSFTFFGISESSLIHCIASSLHNIAYLRIIKHTFFQENY